VPGLYPVLAERGHRPGYRERLRSVLPADPADQAVVLELGQLLLLDPGRLEQLAPGQIGRRAARSQAVGTPEGLGGAAVVGGAGQAFPDHLQRKIGIPLHGEDVTQPLDVRRGEPAVARP
jgi:hypothetical protein